MTETTTGVNGMDGEVLTLKEITDSGLRAVLERHLENLNVEYELFECDYGEDGYHIALHLRHIQNPEVLVSREDVPVVEVVQVHGTPDEEGE